MEKSQGSSLVEDRPNGARFRAKSGLCVLFVFFAFFLVVWPLLSWLMFFFGGRIAMAGGGTVGPWESWAQSYVVLEAMVACVAAVTAIFVYFNERQKRAEEAVFERKRKLTSFYVHNSDKFWALGMEFDEAINDLVDERADCVLPGNAIVTLAKKFLEKDFFETDPDLVRKNDDEFLKECKHFNVDKAAKVLWRILNWMRFQDEYFKAAFPDEKELVDSLHRGLAASFETTFMSAQRRFVFGKHRHLVWNITKEIAAGPTYRGLDYADALLRYHKTVDLLPDSDKKRKYKEAYEADLKSLRKS